MAKADRAGRNGGKLNTGGNNKGAGRTRKLPSLERLVADLWGEDEEGQESGVRRVLKALEAKALKGDTRAIEILLNRTYGLQTQKTEVTGRDGQPLAASFIVKVKDTDNGNDEGKDNG